MTFESQQLSLHSTDTSGVIRPLSIRSKSTVDTWPALAGPALDLDGPRLATIDGPLFRGPPDPTTVRQGISDCFALAAATSVAAFQPEALTRALTRLDDGNILFTRQSPNGEFAFSFSPRVLVDGSGRPLGAYSTRRNEWWPTLIERALASAPTEKSDAEILSGYARLARGGDPGWVMQALTGCPVVEKGLARWSDPDELGAVLDEFARERRPMALLTPDREHAIAIIGVTSSSGKHRVRTLDTSGAIHAKHLETCEPEELLATFSSIYVTSNWDKALDAYYPAAGARRYLAPVAPPNPHLTPRRQRS